MHHCEKYGDWHIFAQTFRWKHTNILQTIHTAVPPLEELSSWSREATFCDTKSYGLKVFYQWNVGLYMYLQFLCKQCSQEYKNHAGW